MLSGATLTVDADGAVLIQKKVESNDMCVSLGGSESRQEATAVTCSVNGSSDGAEFTGRLSVSLCGGEAGKQSVAVTKSSGVNARGGRMARNGQTAAAKIMTQDITEAAASDANARCSKVARTDQALAAKNERQLSSVTAATSSAAETSILNLGERVAQEDHFEASGCEILEEVVEAVKICMQIESVDVAHIQDQAVQLAVTKRVTNYSPMRPSSSLVVMKLTLTDDTPVHRPPRRLAPAERVAVHEQIDEWLRDGIIQHIQHRTQARSLSYRKRTDRTDCAWTIAN